jgi:Trk-type K+ transport system membrane component
VCLVAWIVRNDTWGPVVDSAGVSRVWWYVCEADHVPPEADILCRGFFTSPSALADVGYTLTPDSMNSFPTAVFPLLLLIFLIIIGNTGFPCMLRFLIWVTSKLVPRESAIWEELKFLLDHPRRCFTLLFPSKATWWLFWILVILNGIDLVFYIILDVSFRNVSRAWYTFD